MKNIIFTGCNFGTNDPNSRLSNGAKCSLYAMMRSAITIVMFLGVVSVYATEYTFIGNDADWSNAANWSDGTLPGAGDTGIIAGSEGDVRTAQFYSGGDLAGPPDAIRIQPYGVLDLVDTGMTSEHNLILEGGRFRSRHNRSANTTISLRSDSYLSTSGRYGPENQYIYTLTLNGIIQDYGAEAGKLIVDKGQISLENINNSFSGGTLVRDGGSIYLTINNTLGTGPVELLAGGELHFRTVTVTNQLILNGGYLSTTAGYTLNATLELKSDSEVWTKDYTPYLTGLIRDYDATHAGRLIKTGPGLLVLRYPGTNTYSGGTLIREGTLEVSTYYSSTVGDRPLGSGDVVVTNSGTLNLFYDRSTQYAVDPLAQITVHSNATIRFRSESLTTTHTNILVKAGGNIQQNNSGYYYCYNSIRMEGCVNLHRYRGNTGYNLWYGTFSDGAVPGQLALAGTNSGSTRLHGTYTYTGGTIIRDGGPDAAELTLAGEGRMPDTGVILVESNGVMNFNNISDTVGGLAGVGSVKLGSGTVTCNEGISPGIDAWTGGTLSITGTTGRVVIGSSAVSTFHLRTPDDHDQVVLQGGAGLTLGGQLQIEALDGLTAGEYTLFSLADGAAPEGTFSDLVLPARFGGSVAVIGNDVVLRLADQGSIITIK